jgi:PhnB protein
MRRNDQFIPHLIVHNALEALEFYKGAFGTEEVARVMAPDGKRLAHGEMKLDGHLFYLSDEFRPDEGGSCKSPETLGGTGVRINIVVDDADAVIERASRAGARVLMPAQNMYWGGRYGKLLDPYGHEWGVSQQITEQQTDRDTQVAADEFFANRKK